MYGWCEIAELSMTERYSSVFILVGAFPFRPHGEHTVEIRLNLIILSFFTQYRYVVKATVVQTYR